MEMGMETGMETELIESSLEDLGRIKKKFDNNFMNYENKSKIYNSPYPNEQFIKKIKIEGKYHDQKIIFDLSSTDNIFFRNIKIYGNFTKIIHQLGGNKILEYYPEIIKIIGSPFNNLIVNNLIDKFKLPLEVCNLIKEMISISPIIEIANCIYHENKLIVYTEDKNIQMYADLYSYNPDIDKLYIIKIYYISIFNQYNINSSFIGISKYIILKVNSEDIGKDLTLTLDNKYKCKIKCLNVNSNYNIYHFYPLINFDKFIITKIDLNYIKGYYVSINFLLIQFGMGIQNLLFYRDG